MKKSPIIHRDLGEGIERRLYLGADELRQIKREGGRGFYSLYTNFAENAEPDEVEAVIRLGLIGGGMAPAEASQISGYYCKPPRPLKDVYILAYELLSACWEGADPAKEAPEDKPGMSTEDMDNFFEILESKFLKAGWDVSSLRNKSFAEIQILMKLLNDKKEASEAPAPDAETFYAIKRASKGMK